MVALIQEEFVSYNYNKTFDFVIHEVKSDGEGRILCVDLTINNFPFTICNVYNPYKDSPLFCYKIFEFINQFDRSNIILGSVYLNGLIQIYTEYHSSWFLVWYRSWFLVYGSGTVLGSCTVLGSWFQYHSCS